MRGETRRNMLNRKLCGFIATASSLVGLILTKEAAFIVTGLFGLFCLIK